MATVCGICGHPKKADALMCGQCNTQWRKEAPRLIAQGNSMDIWEWVEAKINAALTEINSALEQKRREVNQLSLEVDQEADRQLTEKLGGKKFDEGILRDARAEIRRPIWKSRGGNRLYFELKQLEAQLQPKVAAAESILVDIARKKRESEQKIHDQHAAALIESALPSDSEA